MLKKKKPLGVVDAKIEQSIKKTKPFADEDVYAIPNTPYTNMVGSFGTMKKKDDKVTGITWEGCRDRFQNASEPEAYQEFLFCLRAKTADNVLDFVRTVEEVIKLASDERAVLKKTSNPHIIYVKFSAWWKYRVRRSLLTALLRVGQDYEDRTRESFLKALYSQYYTLQTKPAVEQFLKGRTASKLKRRSGFGGWHQLFVNKKDKDVREFLVKKLPPEAKPVEPIKDETPKE